MSQFSAEALFSSSMHIRHAQERVDIALANNDEEGLHPYDVICMRAATLLSHWFPSKGNEIFAGLHDYTVAILAADALLHAGCGGFSFHRMRPENQARAIEGIESMMFDLLPDGIVEFYAKKMSCPGPSVMREPESVS